MNRFLAQIALVVMVNISYAQKQVLGFNLSVGDTYYHVMQTKSQINETFNGQDITIDIDVSGKVSFKVLQKNDTVYNMNVSYEQLIMTMNLPTGKSTYSTESDAQDVMSKVLRAFKGKFFIMTMTRFGRILEIKNLDTIFGSIVNAISEVPDQQKVQVKAQLQQSFGEKAFKGNFELVTYIYSNTPVDVGNNWTVYTVLENNVKANMTSTFELKQKDRSFNLITGFSTITPITTGAPAQINGMPTKYDLNGTSDWQLKVDSKTGWVMEGHMKQHIKGSAQIQDNPKIPGGMDIPMAIETEYNFSDK